VRVEDLSASLRRVNLPEEDIESDHDERLAALGL
jgi:hypothetical protein